MRNRIDTRKIMVGNVQIGGNNHVVIQSMTNTKTKTIRVSLSDDPTQEVRAAKEIETFCNTLHSNLKVTVMDCAVNGPGEAREADLGIAGGNNEWLLFKKGEIIRKIPHTNIIEEFEKEILKRILII